MIIFLLKHLSLAGVCGSPSPSYSLAGGSWCELLLPVQEMYSQGRAPELCQHRSSVAQACFWTDCGEFFEVFCLVGLFCCLFVGLLFGVLLAYLFGWVLLLLLFCFVFVF